MYATQLLNVRTNAHCQRAMWLGNQRAYFRNYLASQLDRTNSEANLKNVDAMAHVLGFQRSGWIPSHIDMFPTAIVVGVDIEVFESGPKRITELGISALHLDLLPSNPNIWPIDKLVNMGLQHMRIIENAHLVNGEKCPGHPEKFGFGMTGFVDRGRARLALECAFQQLNELGQLCPIVFIGHAVDNDVQFMKEQLGVDLNSLGVLVMTLDTQVMAMELGMSKNAMSLKNILAQYSVQEQYLHNAGNDIAQTMIAATLMAGERAQILSRNAPNHQQDVDNLKATLRSRHSQSYWGTDIYCTNCESTSHMVGQCLKTYLCLRCAGNPRWEKDANTHPIDKCKRPKDPCKICIDSDDKKLQEDAAGHYTEDCQYNGKYNKPGMYGDLFIPPNSKLLKKIPD